MDSVEYDHIKPTIREEDIPSFDGWYNEKIRYADPYQKYLRQMKEYEEIQDKIDSGEMSIYCAEVSMEMNILAKSREDAVIFAERRWGYDVDIEISEC